MIHKVWDFCLRFLFPPRCVVCGKEGKEVCERCFGRIAFAPREEKMTAGVERLFVAASYHESEELRKIIAEFKYKFVKDLSESLGKKMAEGLPKEKEIVVVPVPLHFLRRWWRGFNQAEELARVIARERGWKMQNILKRTKNTSPQARMKNAQQREENMKEAFVCVDKPRKDTVCLLVDDVCGSGATMGECAKELRKAGAEQVWGVVIARGGSAL